MSNHGKVFLSIKIIHTSDWHIGRAFSSTFEDQDTRSHLKVARFEVIAEIVKIANAENADVILVASDIFENQGVSEQEIRKVLANLQDCDGRVVFIPGNHDPLIGQFNSPWKKMVAIKKSENILVAREPKPIGLLKAQLFVLPSPLLTSLN